MNIYTTITHLRQTILLHDFVTDKITKREKNRGKVQN